MQIVTFKLNKKEIKIMNNDSPNQWWGYVHTDKSLHLKRYYSKQDIDEAYESPFVMSVHGPWEAKSREDAEQKLKKELVLHL